MKIFVAFFAIIAAVNAVSEDDVWIEFKKTHNKSYKSIVEEKLRYTIFQKNLRTIEEHNEKFQKGETSYKLGINEFADWTSEEFYKLASFKIPNIKYTNTFKIDPNFVVPDAIDWREKGAVLEVKSQGGCGSCWAFSATGSIEGQNVIKHNKTISLSEQELLDCTTRVDPYNNAGCDGGNMEAAFQYIADHGIATESDYIYWQDVGKCKNQQKARADVNVTGYVDVDKTEEALRVAVASVGPISVAINSELLHFYESGIFDEPSCSKKVNHGVLAVGYNVENDKEFWIIKNSWGPKWGEKGFFRMARNKDQQCAIGSWNTYPILS